MVLTLRLPGARPLALIIVGALLGALFVGPVAARYLGIGSPSDRVSAAIQTRTASCAGLSFYPTDSATGYANDGTLRFKSSYEGIGTGVFRCDPGLPNKAVVTKVQFTLRDATFRGGVYRCGLVRSGLTVATATSYQTLASVPDTFEAPGIVRFTDSSILLGTIDNAKFGYWLECQVAGEDASVGIYGADVIYTISSADG